MEIKVCNNKVNFHNKKTKTVSKTVPYIKSNIFRRSKQRVCPKCYVILDEEEKTCPNCNY